MIYQIKRTSLDLLGAETTMKSDRRQDYVEAATAAEAISTFLQGSNYRCIGQIETLPGGLAITSCTTVDNRQTVIIRATPIGSDDEARRMLAPSPIRRRAADQK